MMGIVCAWGCACLHSEEHFYGFWLSKAVLHVHVVAFHASAVLLHIQCRYLMALIL